MLLFLLEDDKDIALFVSENLKKEGYQVRHFTRATELFSAIKEEIPELVIIDIMLPDFDGFRVARFIRNNSQTREVPIIFMTARTAEEDKLKGFELGADDYITKPFSVKELMARVNAVLRRYGKLKRKGILSAGGIELDTERVKVYVEGREIKLTPSEFKILRCLMENYGKAVSRDRIIEDVWGLGRDATDRTVDVHIKHLRDKLGEYSGYIKTIRGFGYKFEV